MENYKKLLKHITTFVFDYDGVMTDGKVYLLNNDMARTANVRDGYAIQLAQKKGFRIAVISGGRSEMMTTRMNSLNVTDVFLGVSDKLTEFNNYLVKENIKKEDILFMGDDIPDYPIMLEAGVPTCPADAAEEIKKVSVYISDKNGGEGCVRDVIEQVLKAQHKWFDGEAFHW